MVSLLEWKDTRKERRKRRKGEKKGKREGQKEEAQKERKEERKCDFFQLRSVLAMIDLGETWVQIPALPPIIV